MSKHKHSVGNTSSRVSPPLGHLPDFEIKPLRPRSGADSSPAKGSSIEVTDGSLDEDSLEQAIRVLAGLTEGDRLVGIISHVGALKERVDRQVVVRKARSGGSTVELIV